MLQRMASAPDERATDDRIVLRRLWSYARSDWPTLIGVLLMLILVSIDRGIGPTLIGRAIDQFISNGDRAGLGRTMLLLIGAYVIGAIGFSGQVYLLGRVSQRVLKHLRMDVFNHIQRLSMSYFAHSDSGDLMSRLVNDTGVIGDLFSQSLAQAMGSTFALIGVIIAMFLLDWRLAIASFLMIPLLFLTTRAFSRRARVAYRYTRETIGDISAHLQEDITSIRELQAFDRTSLNISHFEKHNAANRDANIRAASITAAFAPTIDVFSVISMSVVAGVGGWLAFNDYITVGVVVAFIAYVQRFFRPVQQISLLFTQAQAALAAAERVFALLDTVPDLVDRSDAKELPAITGSVRFEDVSFSYEQGTPVLKHVSFEIQPGKTVALVGPTGAGKSTIVNLLARFYDVTDGRVLVDGWDVREVTQHSLRRQIGVVPQETFLFAETIANNVRYGMPEASIEEVVSAATKAQAHDFIEGLAEGYDTVLGERGETISQGQRQLLGIARVLLLNPHLLILDEATANIDTRTEQFIQQALDQLLQERTAFVIAHRLSTIRNADEILVVDDGRIVERGGHEGLLAQGGTYAELYRKQLGSSGNGAPSLILFPD